MHINAIIAHKCALGGRRVNIDISQKNAEIVVLVALGVLLLKEITRHQLLAVINKYMEHGDERKGLQSATKNCNAQTTGKSDAAKKLITLSEGARLSNLKRHKIQLAPTL